MVRRVHGDAPTYKSAGSLLVAPEALLDRICKDFNHTWLCLKVPEVGWIQSVTPRGSGWVTDQVWPKISKIERVYDVPTRYREVVLTLSK